MGRVSDIQQQIDIAAEEFGFECVGSRGVADVFKQKITGEEVLVLPADGMNQKTAAFYIQKFRNVACERDVCVVPKAVSHTQDTQDPDDQGYVLDMTGWPIGFE